MNIFVDTSALVKYFHEEEGTPVVTSLLDTSDNVIVVSELAQLEFISALHRRYRFKELNKESLNKAIEAFNQEYSTFQVQPVSRLIMQEAKELMLKYGKENSLKTLDSIHLATFFLLKKEDWLFVASDNDLIKIAKVVGAKTLNPLD